MHTNIRLLGLTEYLIGITPENITALIEGKTSENIALNKLLKGVLKDNQRIHHGIIWHVLYKNIYQPESLSNKALQLSHNKIFQYVKKYALITERHPKDKDIVDPVIHRELALNTGSPKLQNISKLILLQLTILIAYMFDTIELIRYRSQIHKLVMHLENKIEILISELHGFGSSFSSSASRIAGNTSSENYHQIMQLLYKICWSHLLKFRTHNELYALSELTKVQKIVLNFEIGQMFYDTVKHYRKTEKSKYNSRALFMCQKPKKLYKNYYETITSKRKCYKSNKIYIQINNIIEQYIILAPHRVVEVK